MAISIRVHDRDSIWFHRCASESLLLAAGWISRFCCVRRPSPAGLHCTAMTYACRHIRRERRRSTGGRVGFTASNRKCIECFDRVWCYSHRSPLFASLFLPAATAGFPLRRSQRPFTGLRTSFPLAANLTRMTRCASRMSSNTDHPATLRPVLPASTSAAISWSGTSDSRRPLPEHINYRRTSGRTACPLQARGLSPRSARGACEKGTVPWSHANRFQRAN